MNPEDLDEQMKTLIALRMPESKLRFWRELWQLFLLLLGISLGFGLLGFFQYWNCTGKNPDRTFLECMRYDLETKRIRK